MNVLLVYPKCPDTYWSFRHALKFVKKKAAVPPLGLITVSAMLPDTWQKKLVDLNIEELEEKDLAWADYIFISAMYVQKESVGEILSRSAPYAAKIIAGGPLFTQEYDSYPQIHHFILNEAELTMPEFLEDWQKGRLKRIYRTQAFANLMVSPIPDYHLLNMNAYAFMNIQVSRGCPFNCDFCEITALLGRKVRMKSSRQVLDELETLYQLKWRGSVAVVDDNFIGNKKMVKNHILPDIIAWMQTYKHPFRFSAQTSINLADDSGLLQLMRRAGFVSTFIGIETPVEESLQNCQKSQNENRDLLENVKQIQKAGLQVSGGFIVGFDSDTETVFQQQVEFIQSSGIVTAMVGLLNAPKNTQLYRQMEMENRLTVEATGSNTDFTMNFTPKMNQQVLLEGYQHIIASIYTEKPYYQRIKKLLGNYNPVRIGNTKPDFTRVMGFIKSMYILGFLNKGRKEYWKFIVWILFRKPARFIDAVTFAIYGYHYRKVYGLRSN